MASFSTIAVETLAGASPKAKPAASLSQLRSLFVYDPTTGVVTWSCRRGSRNAGDVVGNLNKDGYLQVKVMGRTWLVHRLAWFLTHGAFTKEQLDHVNCVKTDNRLMNLREATPAENNRNKVATLRDLPKGVRLHRGAYEAQIFFNNKTMYLGRYSTALEAHSAYAAAAQRLHGEFARVA